MKVQIVNVRNCFPQYFEPKTVGGEGEPRFSGAYPIEPGSANAKTLASAVEAVAKEKWGAKAAAILTELKGKGRVCYRESPLSKEGEVYEGFEGMFTLNASNKARPLVVDRDKTPLTAADGRPYAGCYVNVILDLWAQDNSWGKRINATLRGVQFVRDGDAFSGAPAASVDEFESIAEGADAEALA